jgi:hypothetical protein
MHAPAQSLLIGHAQQEGRQEASLFRIEGRKERVLMLARYLAYGLKNLPAARGHLQQIDSPVARVFEPLDQPAVLQLIDERHQPARKQAKPLCDFLLAGPGRGRDDAQSADVRWRQAQWSQP